MVVMVIMVMVIMVMKMMIISQKSSDQIRYRLVKRL